MQGESAYLFELASQCAGAISAVQRMNAVLRGGGKPIDFFHHAQAFINHTGVISRILWPPLIHDPNGRARAQARAAHLRTILNVSSPHPLEDRTLRNHLEHFDERLDAWAASTQSFLFVDLNIGPPGSIAAGPPEQVFRQFDPTTNTLSFRGESFDLQALTAAVGTVAQAVARLRNAE
jgi:hypothetical protein